MNGNAEQENCNCYTLTKDEYWQSGSVWNINKISLLNSFEFNFNIFPGCSDSGADGLVFVLQPISTSVGTDGEGMGYSNVSPSIGVAIDTYQNAEIGDPVYDHITIHRDGIINHRENKDLAGPVMALANNENIEDCNWHILTIVWDVNTLTLSASIDGVKRVEAEVDLVNEIFNGDPMVFWGFTAATGGEKNHQRFCTSLNPGINMLNTTTCFPEPIYFKDSSTSFGEILQWYWDFGDGNKFEGQHPPPYYYSAPGTYQAKLTILGSDGCLSDTLIYTVVAGSEPEADFIFNEEVLCENLPVIISDNSKVAHGTINSRYWTFNNEEEFNANSLTFNKPPGNYNIKLEVETAEGCKSQPVEKNFDIYPQPKVDINSEVECADLPSFFSASSEIEIKEWLWEFSDGYKSVKPAFSREFKFPGSYEFILKSLSAAGCYSENMNAEIFIPGTNAYAGADTVVARFQPVQLQATGGKYYQWLPSNGLSSNEISNPVATLSANQKYRLIVSDDYGCSSEDEIEIKVFEGPEIYIPNAFTPDNDGKNDRFSFLAPGILKLNYFRVFNRFGQLLFQTSEINDSWDGNFKGNPQPAGTYVTEIAVTDYNGKIHVKKNSFILIR